MAKTHEENSAARERVRAIAADFEGRGDQLGWFDEVYRQAAGSIDSIPWADLEPNPFFKQWAEKNGLKGEGRKALVVGCGLGDDARYLYDLGFKVTAFDISPTAIEWARKLHAETDIQFETADLLEPFRGWLGTFDFVLEVYTIQPLPLEMRPRVIDAIASFVALGGELVIVARGRDDEEEPDHLPWPVSRRDLGWFGSHGLVEKHFEVILGDEEVPERRFVVVYERPGAANG